MSTSLNLILGNSPRTAISLLEADRDKEVLCVVSPSPRTERRYDDQDMIDVFTAMGTIMRKMNRFEAHFYSSNNLWLPAQGITGLIRNANKLERFLMNGVRIRGTDLELAELGSALEKHPKLREVTFFNIGPHREDDGSEPCLKPMLEGVARNQNRIELTMRFVTWSNPFLRVLTDQKSRIPSLRLSGKETLYGPEGDGINMGAPHLLEALQSNTSVQEIRINQCAAPVGLGDHFMHMLRRNTHLRKLYLHITNYEESLPIAFALARHNHTLTHLELFVEDPRKRGIIDVESMRPDINRAVAGFEKALATNPTLRHIKLFCRVEVHNSPKMNFYTRMNLAGRFKIITNDELSPDSALTFLSNHSDDHSMMYYILGMKPSMMQLCMQAARSESYKPKQNKSADYEDFSDDDDLPITVLARRARSEAENEAKKKAAAALKKEAPPKAKRRRFF